MKIIKKKKFVEVNKKRVESRVRDKRVVQMQARICDPGLTLKQRRMILHEAGKWRG